jgi:hypothetical protein
VRTDPERELVRRILPFAPVAVALAFGIGSIAGGVDAGASAAIGIVVVSSNLVAQGFSIAWAARISPVAVAAVGLGGFVVRIGILFVLLILLDRLAFFSALAFVLAVVPTTIAVLAVEMRLVSGRWGSELWTLPSREEPTAT